MKRLFMALTIMSVLCLSTFADPGVVPIGGRPGAPPPAAKITFAERVEIFGLGLIRGIFTGF